jgi:hypothetical protein
MCVLTALRLYDGNDRNELFHITILFHFEQEEYHEICFLPSRRRWIFLKMPFVCDFGAFMIQNNRKKLIYGAGRGIMA